MAWASPVFNLVPCYSTSSGVGGVDSSDALVRDAGAAFDYAVSTNDVGSCGEEPPARVSSRACRRFRRSGYCKYGNSCFYNHVSADEFVEEALNNYHIRDVQTEDEVMDDTVIIADAVEATPLSAENSERNANDHYSTDFLPYVEVEEAAIECMSTTDVEYFRDWLDYSFAAWRRYTMQVTNTHKPTLQFPPIPPLPMRFCIPQPHEEYFIGETDELSPNIDASLHRSIVDETREIDASVTVGSVRAADIVLLPALRMSNPDAPGNAEAFAPLLANDVTDAPSSSDISGDAENYAVDDVCFGKEEFLLDCLSPTLCERLLQNDATLTSTAKCNPVTGNLVPAAKCEVSLHEAYDIEETTKFVDDSVQDVIGFMSNRAEEGIVHGVECPFCVRKIEEIAFQRFRMIINNGVAERTVLMCARDSHNHLFDLDLKGDLVVGCRIIVTAFQIMYNNCKLFVFILDGRVEMTDSNISSSKCAWHIAGTAASN